MTVKARFQSIVCGQGVAGITAGLVFMAAMVAFVFAAAIATDPDARLSTAISPSVTDTAATGANTGEAGAE